MNNGGEVEESRFASLPVVRSMGRMSFDPCWAIRPHLSGSCELLHIIDGKMLLHIGRDCFTAQAGELLLIPMNTAHRDEFDLKRGLEVFMVHFTWEAQQAYFSLLNNDRIQAMPAARRAVAAREVERLSQSVTADSPTDRLIARSRLHTILMILLRQALQDEEQDRAVATGQQRKHTLMLAARRYLETNYHRPLTLEEIAQALDVSTFYLSHVFSEESDFSLFAYLTNLRMDKARDMLLSGKLNVSEVADAVGYENSNYFAKVFRKHFGNPPSAYIGKRNE